MRIFITLFLLLALTATLNAAEKPNVILIMVDDLGYQDLSCYGHPAIKTPVLDQLAKEGVRLTDFYSGATVCTPSRMALMTGAYPPRVGWTKGVIGYKMGWQDGMSPEALTIAEIFKSEGYRTALFGKWHLGNQPETRPHRQGFDETFYIDKSNNQTKKLWRDDEVVIDPKNNDMLTKQFTDEALLFIEKNKEKPFFLYLPYTVPHFPVGVHKDWLGKSAYKHKYGDAVEELDARIGTLLAKLKEEKLDKKTIVLFCSDNGPNPGEKAGCLPLRGEKWSPLEGGTRVPCIVNYPGVIPPGQVCREIVGAIDLLPTLCTACNIDWKSKSQGKPKIDGVNVWPTLLGKKVEHPRTELLYWHGMNVKPQAIRVGDWKLFPTRGNALRGLGSARKTPEQAKKLEKLTGNGPALFNLRKDPGETVDLSAEQPERVAAMQKRLDEIAADIANGDIIPISLPAKEK